MDTSQVIRIAGIVNDSIVDGPGIRMTVFVQGCPHNCEGCHNPQTHDFVSGEDMTIADILSKIKTNPLLDGVTFSGGEPFCQAEQLAYLGQQIKAMGLNIMTYSGYTYDYLIRNANEKNHWRELINISDWLVDGPFVLAQKNLTLKFRGSSNQRIIDIRKSIEQDKVVISELQN